MKSYPLSIDDAKKSEQNDEILIVKKTLAQEFFDFLKTFGVIGLALAFVVGQAASGLVTSLVNDIINPLIGLFLPSGNLDEMSAKVINISGEITVFSISYHRTYSSSSITIINGKFFKSNIPNNPTLTIGEMFNETNPLENNSDESDNNLPSPM